MGWTYYKQPGETAEDQKRYLINELTRDTNNPDYFFRVIEHHCGSDNVLWMVIEAQRKTDDRKFRYISCVLLDDQDQQWGYKGMDEAVGPAYYSCPLSFLDLAPEDNLLPEFEGSFAKSWRKKVLGQTNQNQAVPA